MPALPVVESASMAPLDDATYWTLADRERRLTDWALEMRGMLEEVCAR
ncbi:hypothetical protein [Salinicola rhizosphaerae]|uniref:Uncharacterized protein n=1 Tax=Salinicola rhizosphaerae TaxID=1443141 RepID=A0ABQ3ECQ7_9GAMM|nr:hypothetical protein [Salinicola rhizosphaerae]GHB30576.1 hypothetical protein GCM10009038_31710 [Salinicola rhizosphaerae]